MAATNDFLAFSLLFIFILHSRCHGILLDVHLSLRTIQNATTDLCPYHMALNSNLALRHLSVKEEIDFFNVHTPHITLYQADFDIDNKTKEFINAAVAAIGNQAQPCHIAWPSSNTSIVSNDYAMHPIKNAPCLQQLSNRMVETLQVYIHRPPPIPEWIYSLPLEERRRALQLVKKYGSPNVFARFQPHVTVGYDTVYPTVRRKAALETLVTPNDCKANVAAVSIALVGVGGSVLQNGVIGQIQLSNESAPSDTVAPDVSEIE